MALLVLALGAVVQTPAHATGGGLDLVCSPFSVDKLFFTPSVALAPQSVTIDKKTNYRYCYSPSAPDVVSGELVRLFTRSDSCPQALLSGPTSQTITWNTGQTSTIGVTRTPTLEHGIYKVTFVGTVTAGLFTGSSVTQVYLADGRDLERCLAGDGTVVDSLISVVLLSISH
ncbi:hypothetical protein [Rhizocola hellebori]|uniref:hypothetical protein n=1 Tax=Rhizocola hellebori TaxID=1392758 RepID=UPI0019407ECE|nr:hypothetical protein [Rhizocola hellebori]